MAELKWIKLSLSMFDDEKIKIIESLPEKDAIIVIWVKLLVLAGKTNDNGFIYLNKNISYTDEMLSTLFNRPVTTIRLALKTLQDFEMINISDNQLISISNWDKHQNIEGMEKIREQTRKRVSEHRELSKKKALLTEGKICAYCGKPSDTTDHIIPKSKGGPDIKQNLVPCCKSCNSSKKDKDIADFLNDSKFYKWQEVDFRLILSNETLMQYLNYDKKNEVFEMKPCYCNVTVTQSNATEEERRKKKEDIDKEVVEDTEVSREISATAADEIKDLQCESEIIEELESKIPKSLDFYEQNFAKPSGKIETPYAIATEIIRCVENMGDDLVLLALQRTLETGGTRDWKYAKAILIKWHDKGIKTVEEANAEQKPTKQQNSTSTKKSKFNNYDQRKYDFEEIEREEMERTLREIEKLKEGKT